MAKQRSRRGGNSPRYGVEIDQKTWRKVEAQMKRIPLEVKEKALKKGIREASKLVGLTARGNITQPGYEGDKDPGRYPPLSKNIKWVVRGRKRESFVAGHVGADYKKAPHFHLYEQGHRMVTRGGNHVGFVMGQRDFKRTVDETKAKQGMIVVSALRDYAKSLAGK